MVVPLEKVDLLIWAKKLKDVSLWEIRKDVARLCAAYREGSGEFFSGGLRKVEEEIELIRVIKLQAFKNDLMEFVVFVNAIESRNVECGEIRGVVVDVRKRRDWGFLLLRVSGGFETR